MTLLEEFILWFGVFIVMIACIVLVVIFCICPKGPLKRHAYAQTVETVPDLNVVVIHPNQEIDLSSVLMHETDQEQ